MRARETTWEKTFMDMAENLSKMGYDPKYKVGCIITSEDHQEIFSIGINGNCSGFPNERESLESGESGFIHAEENAIIKNRSNRFETKNVYITYLPCKKCAKLICQIGNVKNVYFKYFYEDTTGMEVFQKAGINLYYLTE
jgi:deoxycytidylate deaminase